MIPGTVPCVVSSGHDTAGLSPVSRRSGICKRFLTRCLQKLHLIVSGKKIVNRPSVGCDVMPHAATVPSYINKFSHNVISSLRLPGVFAACGMTSPPTDGQIASLLAFASRIVQRLRRHVRNLRRFRCATTQGTAPLYHVLRTRHRGQSPVSNSPLANICGFAALHFAACCEIFVTQKFDYAKNNQDSSLRSRMTDCFLLRSG